MSLADVCIRRPVTATMLILSLVVLGLFSYGRLGVDLFPNVDFPWVSVTTTLRGASAEEIESTVTKPVEEAVNTIDGIVEVTSISREGVSVVVLQFDLAKDGGDAAEQVRAKIAAAAASLPVDADPPVVNRFQFDATPILSVVVSGDRDFREITEIARKRIKERIETIRGVGQVILVGGRDRAINVLVDPDRLEAYGISILQARAAIRAQNVELPGGRIERRAGEWVVRTMGRVRDREAFENLVIARVEGQGVRIRDVGFVEDGVVEPRSLSRLDGRSAVQLVIRKQSGANTVEVVDRVAERLEEIREILPPDIEFHVVRDQSRFIRLALEEVQFHLVLGGILVAVTVLLFMHDWRSTLIASVAIPASIVSTFTAMHYFGFTVNNITMLGLVLAVGIVIDDAVVVLENIHRYVEEKGVPPLEAASAATREISLAVVATTLSLVIIFVPIAFMGGQVGRFFSSFGITVAVSVLISMLISFTLTPTLSSRFLRSKSGERQSRESFLYSRVDGAYGWLLRYSLRHRWQIVLASAALFASTFPLFQIVGKNFFTPDDQSEIEVLVQTPGGYTIERVSEIFEGLENRIRELPGVTHVLTTIGETSGQLRAGQGDVTRGSLYVRLVEIAERDFTQFDVMDQVRAMFADYPDLRTSVQEVSQFAGAGQRSGEIELHLLGPDLDRLETLAGEIVKRMNDVPRIVDADTSLSVRFPELRVRVDRERVADLGVRISDVAETLQLTVGGQPISTFLEGDEQIDVWLRSIPQRRADVRDLYNLSVPAADGTLYKLSNVVEITPDLGPAQIDRLDRQRKVSIFANLLPGLSLSEAVAKIDRIVREVDLPPGYDTEWGGQAENLGETGGNFVLAFGLSFLFMYMILAAQFESFLHPITILAALPLTIPCALLSLILLGQPMNLYSVFGVFMLFGIVKKNGILQIDYTNTLRDQGMDRDQAILEANHVRLRPILMTTLMLIAAMIPIALGQGPGALSRASIAQVIIGGQGLSLVITLLITPVAYSLFDDLGRIRRRRAGLEPGAERDSHPIARSA